MKRKDIVYIKKKNRKEYFKEAPKPKLGKGFRVKYVK